MGSRAAAHPFSRRVEARQPARHEFDREWLLTGSLLSPETGEEVKKPKEEGRMLYIQRTFAEIRLLRILLAHNPHAVWFIEEIGEA
jgi:hypothetical protein